MKVCASKRLPAGSILPSLFLTFSGDVSDSIIGILFPTLQLLSTASYSPPARLGLRPRPDQISG